MDRDRFAEIERVCQGALDRSPAERAAFLDEVCRGNESLRAEVEALLAGASGTTSVPYLACRPEAEATLEVGRKLGPYTITGRIGGGGMGEVYKAQDTRLDRTVAIKVLSTGTDFAVSPLPRSGSPLATPGGERRARFVRESRAIAGLNHPNICALYDVGREGDIDFLVMEHIEGTPLRPPYAVDTALGFAIQIAGALCASHERGIIHRDLKPSNVMVTPAGQVKVLDFGLAKRLEVRPSDDDGRTRVGPGESSALTHQGVAMGTLSYMSPEQVEGKRVDTRSDVFSFGALLYELLTGRRAFAGESAVSTLSAVLRDTPPPPSTVRAEVPAELDAIVGRCLQKDRDARFASAADLHAALLGVQAKRQGRRDGLRVLCRPRVLVPLAVVLVAALAAGGWWAYRASRARWARNVALPEIVRLAATGPSARAFLLAREAIRYVPEDATLRNSLRSLVAPVRLETDPPGALVQWQEYGAGPDTPWITLGTTPLQAMAPNAFLRWRITKDGFEPLDLAFSLWTVAGPKVIPLKRTGWTPPGMVRVIGGGYGAAPSGGLEEYFLDKHEVTNRQFKEFVDAGGYRTREHWRHRFVKDGHEVAWEQAMAEFRDTTGRPGPSTWAFGSYPDGQAGYPVGGVSWYEADAYAAFRGRSLPTVHHWRFAADVTLFSDILQFSNFGPAPVPVGTSRGTGPWGTSDMAGNVKEWCANTDETGDRRGILGGGFGEAGYMYETYDAQPAFRRVANFGLRCAKYQQPLADALLAPRGPARRDYAKEQPVDEPTFGTYRRMFAYDPTPLNAVVESVDDSLELWRREKIAFDAAYGESERVTAYLFLPKTAAPPYQVVVFFPGGYALRSRTSANLPTQFFEGIVRAGRAVIHPIYKGHFERGGGVLLDLRAQPNALRDRMIAQYRDMARAIDYLETRPDIDATKLAFMGTSMGVTAGAVSMSIESRFKASILVSGGLLSSRIPAETDILNFVPRATMPTILLAGRYDFMFPVETSQKPLFRRLGAPDRDKKHVILERSGHFIDPEEGPRAAREILDWLDRYVGPVRTK